MADYEFTQGDVRVSITGLNAALRALSQAGADAQSMKDLMHSVGMVVVNGANPPALTGRLSASVRAGRGKTKAVVRAGGARIPYAGVIHYGWPARNIAPNPFLSNALAAKRPEAFSVFEEGIQELLKKNGLV